jgi:hypothetical protein
MKTHVDSSQTYPCNICGKEFKRADHRKRHEESHDYTITCQVQQTDCWKTGDCDFVVALEDFWMVQGMEVSSSLLVFGAKYICITQTKETIKSQNRNKIILTFLPKHSVCFYCKLIQTLYITSLNSFKIITICSKKFIHTKSKTTVAKIKEKKKLLWVFPFMLN